MPSAIFGDLRPLADAARAIFEPANFTRSLSLPTCRQTTESTPRRQTSLASASRDLSISLLQAIKELVSRSELPTPVDDTKDGLSHLNGGTPSLIGTFPLTSSIRGLRTRKDNEKVVGLAWSDSELLVRTLMLESRTYT